MQCKLFILISIIVITIHINCLNTNGMQPVIESNSPCLCNNQLCYASNYCNEKLGGCSRIQSSTQDNIELSGEFTFEQLQMNDNQFDGVRVLDIEFNTKQLVSPAYLNIIDNGDGTQWTKYNTRSSENMPDGVYDIVVQQRLWSNHSILKSGYFFNIEKNELALGNHLNEIIVIQRFEIGNRKTYADGISILDFNQDPPTRFDISTMNQLENYFNLNLNHSELNELMHANSAGVDIDGNQWMFFEKSSIFIAFDRQSFQTKYIISNNINSDYLFTNKKDKFYEAQDINQLPNRNWLMFDKGIGRPESEDGQYSRCIEYKLDNEFKTIEKIWEFKINSFCQVNGSCRRMTNGNTIIGQFGCGPKDQQHNELYDVNIIKDQVQEVDKDGIIIGIAKFNKWYNFELYMAIPSNQIKIKKESDSNIIIDQTSSSDQDILEIQPQVGIIINLIKSIMILIIIVLILIIVNLIYFKKSTNKKEYYDKENMKLNDDRRINELQNLDMQQPLDKLNEI